MPTYRSARQPDLFGTPTATTGSRWGASLEEPPPADFTDGIRRELVGMLARARAADAMPWRDLTAATLAELRFNAIVNWLPDDEADTLRHSFAGEMARLWAIEEQKADDAP